MTDREIMDIIKFDLVSGETADFLTLDVVDLSESKKMLCFSEEYWDDMFKTLFDYSLTKNIVVVKSRRLGVDELSSRIGKKSYNGSKFPIIGYTFGLQDSEDHSTNITPRLMKFIEVVMTRVGIDRLAFPMGRNRIEYEFRGYNDGTSIIYTPSEDPWTWFERYLAEGDEEETSNG